MAAFAQTSPTLLAPSNGATLVPPATHTLSWYYISTTPVTYTLQVSISQSFSGTLVLNSTISGVNFYNNVPGLLSGTTYYWRVRASTQQGTTGWSGTWSFTTSGFPPNPFTITASAGANGTISPSGNVTVTPGSDQRFIITPNPNYTANVLVNGNPVDSTTSYTFTNIQSNKTISVSFVRTSYSIVASAGANGSISPSGNITLLPGNNQTFNITPATGYHITDVLVDGVSVGAVPTYQFTNILADHTISATFAINTYTITVTSTTHGTVSPPGNIIVNHGSNQAFTFTPDSGYFVSNRVVNGVSIGPNNGYTFTNVTSNQTLHVVFSDQYTIISSSTSNGSISPLGTILKAPGSSQQYTFTPGSWMYHLSDLIVDGVSVDSTSSYTFSNINSGHTIHAVFDRIVDTLTATVLGDSGGTISPSGTLTAFRGDSIRFYFTPDPGYASLGFSVNGAFVSYDSSYLFMFNYAQSHQTITASFRPIKNVYISPAGDDFTGNGTEANPYKTISRANIAAQVGDTIIMANGIYNEVLSLLQGRNARGGSSTYVDKIIIIGMDHFSIKNIKINNTLPGISPVSLTNCHDFELDNITVTGSGGGPAGLFITQSYNFKITNSDFSNNAGTDGVKIIDSHHFEFTDVESSFNVTGFQVDSVSSFKMTNITSSNNILYGTHIDNARNGVIKNIVSNHNRGGFGGMEGLIISSSSGLTFTDGEFINNGTSGVLISTLAQLFNSPVGQQGNISNITFNGSFYFNQNIYGIALATNLAVNSYAIVSPVFDGRFIMDDNFINDVHVENKILDPVFKGFQVTKVTPALGIAFDIKGTNSAERPTGVVINNNVFGTGVLHAIVLETYTDGLIVDGRYNDFSVAIMEQHIPFFIIDSTDTPGNIDLGIVDYSGSSFGPTASITPEIIPDAFKGASYLVDFDIDVKQTPYFYIKGKYTYDISLLDYLGYVSNGLMNQALWNLSITEPTPGNIEFTGFGTNPIDTDGTLFKLNMRILPGAAGTSAALTPSGSFTGNDSLGAILGNPGGFVYTEPSGPLQERGDVTLDAAVDMDDFYALLFHLGGSIIITDPQALDNADFDLDDDVDNDDLNDLYAFITTGILPSGSVAAGDLIVGNVTYDNMRSSASIPVFLEGAENLSSLEATFVYDPDEINFKAFTSEEASGNLVYAFESKPGEAKFIYQSSSLKEGNINTGNIIMNFKEGKVPVGASMQVYYKMNGTETFTGPGFEFTETGIVTSISNQDNNIPDKYDISQNYPNPFNPVTNIRFSLPEASNVIVKIYDMLGQEVKTLVNESMNPGWYELTWNGRNEYGQNVSSGTYIYRISAGNFVQSKKMILMK